MNLQDTLWLLLAAAVSIMALAICFRVSLWLLKKTIGGDLYMFGKSRDAKIKKMNKKNEQSS